MSEADAATLLQQHSQLMAEVTNVYLALAVCAFIGVIFLAAMIGAAVWSVRMVNNRQRELEAKFTLLIDVLLERARRDIAARRVNVQAEQVTVEELEHDR